jgi:four helix bundle protein
MARVLSFRDLIVYQRAYRLSLDIHRSSLGFPKMEQYALADQMRRASKSICANLAEGFGKGKSPMEMRRFTLMALGSCEEMRVWLRYCLDLEFIDKKTWEKWRDEYVSIAQLLQKLAQSKEEKGARDK